MPETGSATSALATQELAEELERVEAEGLHHVLATEALADSIEGGRGDTERIDPLGRRLHGGERCSARVDAERDRERCGQRLQDDVAHERRARPRARRCVDLELANLGNLGVATERERPGAILDGAREVA